MFFVAFRFSIGHSSRNELSKAKAVNTLNILYTFHLRGEKTGTLSSLEIVLVNGFWTFWPNYHRSRVTWVSLKSKVPFWDGWVNPLYNVNFSCVGRSGHGQVQAFLSHTWISPTDYRPRLCSPAGCKQSIGKSFACHLRFSRNSPFWPTRKLNPCKTWRHVMSEIIRIIRML